MRRYIRIAIPTFALMVASAMYIASVRIAVLGQSLSADVQSIVEQFYPQALVDKANAHPAIPLSRQSSFAVYDRWPDGTTKTIVAAYSNGVDAAVRVLQRQAGGATTLLFESLDFGDAGPRVDLLDVDGNGSNEILVSFVSFTGIETTDVFRWDGSRLLDIGPDGATLTNASFVDLHHDGTLAIVMVDDPHPPARPDDPRTTGLTMFRLTAGKYILDRPILKYASFTRKTGAPQTEDVAFRLLPDSTGPYLLRIINGDLGGANRVSSGSLLLNGVEVVSQNEFNQQVEFLSVPVNLLPENTLEIRLAGKPGGKIIVTVEDTAAVARARQQAARN